jgi:H+/Cl- antiporter ClcA
MNQGRTFKRFFVTRPDRVTIALFAVALVALVVSLVLTPTPAYWEVLEGKRHHQIRVFHDPKHLADYLILALRVLAIGSLIVAWIRHADRASTIQDVIDQEAREKDDGVAASHVGAVHLEEPRHY